MQCEPEHEYLSAAAGTRAVVLVVHAFGSSPAKYWYRAFAEALSARSQDTRVEVLRMSEPRVPCIGAWVQDVHDAVAAVHVHVHTEPHAAVAQGSCTTKLLLVGHSVGCQTIVRFLATPGAAGLLGPGSPLQLRGVLCLAAWFAVDEPWPDIAPWCDTPMDCAAARMTLGAAPLMVLLSDNDRYTTDTDANATAWRKGLGAEVRVLHARQHFAGKNQPEALEAAELMLLNRPTSRLAHQAGSKSTVALSDLPAELLALALSALDGQSLARATATCRAWRTAVEEKGVWTTLLRRDFAHVGALCGPTTAACARKRYVLAARLYQCGQCYSSYRAGDNVQGVCGRHPGVMISGHRENGMRARWTCCGHISNAPALSATREMPAHARAAFCQRTRHRHRARSAGGGAAFVTANPNTPELVAQHVLDGSGTLLAARDGDEGVRDVLGSPTLAEEALRARRDGQASVSWL